MGRGPTFLGVTLLAACLVGQRGSAQVAESWPPREDHLDPAARAALLFERGCRAFNAPGASLAVAQGDRLVLSMGFGYSDLDNLVPATGSTVYNVGSISKVMTAVAVMQLVEQGTVSLEDDIRDYVPSFPDKGHSIGLWHVMTHTSGIRHYADDDFPNGLRGENVHPYRTFEQGLSLFADDPLLFAPGEFHSYSSYAVNLLQGAIEAASGRLFEEYMREHVWGPAGMLRTGFDVPGRVVPGRAKSYLIEAGRAVAHPYEDVTYKFASGGMLSTVEDLARFAMASSHGRLIRPETLARMGEPQLEGLAGFDGPRKRGQGLMWEVGTDEAGRDFLYHGGSVKGFGAGLVLFPQEDLAVAIAANSYNGPAATLVIAGFFLSGEEGK